LIVRVAAKKVFPAKNLFSFREDWKVLGVACPVRKTPLNQFSHLATLFQSRKNFFPVNPGRHSLPVNPNIIWLVIF
jgi:hypothetical protein